MTTQIEVLDALMGSGKTHAIITYMSQHQDKPWLYVSPMLEEVDNRVPNRAAELGFELYVPTEDKINTKSDNCLKALRKGLNICCTHNLMYKFTKDHLHEIKTKGYHVVSDEELNLINGYNIKQDDVDFMLSNNIIKISEDTGAVSFLDEDMSLNACYGDVKAKCDLGMLYASKRSNKFMVTQLSPRIIDCAERFILLTYNYRDSLMQTFLTMHNYEYKNFDEVQLFKSNAEIKKDLLERIEFIETPSIRKIQEKYSLSKSWWVNAKKEEREEISKCILSIVRSKKLDRKDFFYTAPKDYVSKDKGFDIARIGKEAVTDKNGEVSEITRTFIPCNARSTDMYRNKEYAIQCYNLFPNQAVKAFIQGHNLPVNDDVFALNMMLQWLFRGCIRKKGDEKLKVAILSRRMSVLFKKWLMENQV